MAAVLYRLRALLRTGWPATAGIAAVVAITGGLALTLAAGAVRTITAPDRYLDSLDNPFEAQVSQQSGAPRSDELEGLPATGSVGVATFVFGGLVGEGDDGPADVLVFAGSATAFGDRLVDGRQAAPDRPGEFVATRSFLDSTGADLGATFRLLTFTAAQGRDQGFDAQPEGPTFDATLVGVLDGPAGLSDDYALALFPSSLLDAGDIGISASIASVVLEPGSGIDDLRAQVADLPDSDQLSVERATPIDDDVRAAVSAQGQGLTVLAAIAAVTTIIVLGQLLSRQYRLADGERVVLSSLGLTRTQLLVEPVVRAAVAAVAGTVAAVALAFLCSGLFPRGFVTLMEPHPGRLFDPIVLIAGAVALIASLLTWVLISLAAGDRDAAPVRSNRLIDRLVPAVPSVGAALGLHFAFTPGPGRSRGPRVSFIGLIFIAGLLFGALTFGRNLTLAIDEPERYGVNFDLAIGQGGEVTRADLRPLLDDPELAGAVAGVTLYGSLPVQTGRTTLSVVGMQPLKGRRLPEILSGRLPEGPAEIAIGRVSARRLDIGVGDTMSLASKDGPRVLRVTGTVQPPPVGGSDLVGDAGVVTMQAFGRIAPDTPMNTAVIDLAPGAPADIRQRIAEATGMRAGPTDPPPGVINLGRVRSIPFLVAAVVGALAMLSLGHQLLIAVRRRRLDLAVLRALGTSRRGLTGVIHMQASIVTLAVLVVAVPLGIAAGTTAYRPYVDRIGARPDLVVPLWWVLATAAALLVLANVVSAVPARRARRSSPSRVLARA